MVVAQRAPFAQRAARHLPKTHAAPCNDEGGRTDNKAAPNDDTLNEKSDDDGSFDKEDGGIPITN